MEFLKSLSYRVPEGKHHNSNALVQYPARHLQSHNINATSPANMQHVTHIFSAVQQDYLALKMKAKRHSEAPRTASHPSRTDQSATPLTEPEITQQ